MKIYNLFPPLAGPIHRWRAHAARARALGFDWLLLNPICDADPSGGIYAVRDPLRLHSALTDDGSGDFSPLEDFIRYCHRIGLKILVEVELLALSRDSAFFRDCPACFRREANGDWHHPIFYEKWQVKEILSEMVELDDSLSGHAERIFRWRLSVLEHYRSLGVDGIKIIAPWRSPAVIWRQLLEYFRQAGPCLFVADTLGARIDEVRDLALSGFDLVYNSSKYWDFEGDWCLAQYDQLREICGSVSFPETHDTERLINELNGDVRMIKMRYTFAALFSQALLMPMGFEFGFRRRLNARTTTPADWESVQVDLSSFIRRVNDLKDRYTIFRREARMLPLVRRQQPLFIVLRQDDEGGERALIVINTDPWSWQEAVIEDLPLRLGRGRVLLDESPEYMMDGVPGSFRYSMRPAQVKVLCSRDPEAEAEIKR